MSDSPAGRYRTNVVDNYAESLPEVTAQRLAALVSGAAAVTATGDLSELLAATAETARETTGAKYAAIGVIGEHGTLSRVHPFGIPERTGRGDRASPDRPWCSRHPHHRGQDDPPRPDPGPP